MTREEIVTKKIIIEETRIIRELYEPRETPKKDFYRWLEEHIWKILGLTSSILIALAVIGIAAQHTYHIFW